MPELQRLRADHALAVLAFELANRVYFAASVSDRGDEFYDRFTERHAALLAEQEAGIGAFYVLVAGDGSVLGRFNLYRFEDGTAELGYRVAQHVAGRGMATASVRELCGLAAARYGLRTLKAATSRENATSQKVLARAGFIPVGPADPADVGGKQGTWYQRDLLQPLSSSLLVRGYAVSRSCGLGEVLLPGVAFEVAGVVGVDAGLLVESARSCPAAEAGTILARRTSRCGLVPAAMTCRMASLRSWWTPASSRNSKDASLA